MNLKKRHHVKDSKIRDLTEKLKPKLGEKIEEILNGEVEKAKLEDNTEIFLVDKQPFMFKKDRHVPLIFSADKLSLKEIIVDMGAVEFVTNGADVMAPGIVEIDENIKSGDIVAVKDEKNRKILAIGRVLEDKIMEKEEGKMVENLHFVGDDFWDLNENI